SRNPEFFSVVYARLFVPLLLALAPVTAPFLFAFERGERPQAVFDGREARTDDRFDDFLGGLVARRGFVNRHVAVDVDDDAGFAVLAVDLALIQAARRRAARQAAARAMIDRVGALDRARLRT